MPLTVLFSSAGRRTELLNCFRADAQELGIDLRVLAIDITPELSSACQTADRCFRVPRCTAPDFVPSLLRICEEENVDLVIPTLDIELEVFANSKQKFTSIGTRIVVSSKSTIKIARNKLSTAFFLLNQGIPTPRTATIPEVLSAPTDWQWPLILKPMEGCSSLGIERVSDLAEFTQAATRRDDFLVQELWKGREFTVNIFFDRLGVLQATIPHWRIETRAGEVSKGMTWREPQLMAIAAQIAAVLPGACGPLCFQAILRDDGQIAVFEINARFGGGYPLAHSAGAQFSKWLLEEAAGLPSTAHNNWVDRWMMLRYDAAIFGPVPLDL